MPRKEPRRAKRSGSVPVTESPVFGSENYKLMAAAAGLIFAGFAIMALENEISGFFSLYISPVLVVAGFIVFGWGIIRKPAEQQAPN
ncbi:MAG: DUF3098 domain-containing protein [Candidatus Cyclonatronum sp.]|uniref:DUF3098 domain-containing protein n=1 Tax=Cyclonatronum sp. TaxID=3024185 RepID=UPI0025C680B9|nr:hypothetical protein [Cyclonatronum sp.]MCC5933789.1 hypothetical protein [Balneolales bacterium]MCH8488205.1 DUF3098 domain-containing protein [Cyclonatronum sp.]